MLKLCFGINFFDINDDFTIGNRNGWQYENSRILLIIGSSVLVLPHVVVVML